MHIEHIALWTLDLERLKAFYETYFAASSNEKYSNDRQFESYFLSFDQGPRLEIMTMPDVHEESLDLVVGHAHFAFSLGAEGKVDVLTQQLAHDGYEVLSQPRRTGDGYYESVIADPDGNHVEITV